MSVQLYAPGVVAPKATNSPEFTREIDANNLFLEVDFPAPLICELRHYPFKLDMFWDDVTVLLRRYWAMKIQTGQMPWTPLQPETVARKKKKGIATPEYPMVGERGDLVRMIQSTAPQHVEHKVNSDGIDITVLWGPGPGQDQHPSERYGDLFYGSPKDMEESMRYIHRGIVPRRPLVLDEDAKRIIHDELQRWVSRFEREDDTGRYCFDEKTDSIRLLGSHAEDTLPDGIGAFSTLQAGTSAPQYLLTEPQ